MAQKEIVHETSVYVLSSTHKSGLKLYIDKEYHWAIIVNEEGEILFELSGSDSLEDETKYSLGKVINQLKK